MDIVSHGENILGTCTYRVFNFMIHTQSVIYVIAKVPLEKL